MLEHRERECAGGWVRGAGVHPAAWRCAECGAAVLETPDVRREIEIDATLGRWMAELAEEGSRLLRVERS